jgi:hypothetical protein
VTLPGVSQFHPCPRQAQAVLVPAFLWFAGLTYLLICIILLVFLPPWLVIAQASLSLGIYLAWRWPTGVIAAILLLAPLQPLSAMILKAAGFEWVTAASSLKELGLLAAVIVLAGRARIHLAALDFILLALFSWAVLVSCLQSNSDTLISLKDDFDFLLSFYAGRLILLNKGWIRAGLWTAGAVAFLGMIEFFVIGPEMRMLLMRVTDPAELAASFRAESFSGIRAASTLASPLEFGGYCAVGLIVFAAFHQELGEKYLLPALLLACGLLISLTRMAWLGAFLGLSLVAVRQRRILQLALIGVGAALLAGVTLVPYLDLDDYVTRTLSGAEQSERGHALSLAEKSEYVLAHPLGQGAGSVGPRAADRNSKALEVESTFLMFGIAYGWPGLLLFSGFYLAVVLMLLPKCSTMGLAASAVAVAMGCMLMLSPIHIEFPLNSWVWVLLGFATGEPSSRWSWRIPKPGSENPCPQPVLP